MTLFPRNWFLRVLFVLSTLVTIVGLVWWRGPNWGDVGRAFELVSWGWIAAAIGLSAQPTPVL